MTWGYRSFVGFTGDGRRGVVILSNTAADADDLGFATLDAHAPLAPAYKAITLPGASLDQYEGTYKLADKFLLTVFRTNDELFVRATGQQAFPILASAPNEFFGKSFGIGISFTRDASGVVDGLVLHQNGDHAAPKLSASELPPEFRDMALNAATLGDYVGKYRGSFGLLEVVLKSNHLEAQITGQPAFTIYASTKDVFIYKIVDAQLAFERNTAGNVVAVVLHQGGGQIRARRMAAQE